MALARSRRLGFMGDQWANGAGPGAEPRIFPLLPAFVAFVLFRQRCPGFRLRLNPGYIGEVLVLLLVQPGLKAAGRNPGLR